MANYQNYLVNAQNNGENVQFNSDMQQNNLLMINSMEAINQGNKSHALNPNSNSLLYAFPSGGVNLSQPLLNSFHPQYLNGGVNLLQMGNHQLGVYFNNHSQFNNSDGYMNGVPQFIQIPNINGHGMMQVDLNEQNKNIQQNVNNNSRQSKKIYNNQPQESGEIEYDHKNRPLIYSCKQCPRKFSMNSRLSTHMRCHNDERPFVCGHCNFAFTQKSYLVRHAAVHREERPYQCQICKKTYKHYGSLANHRKTHKNGYKSSHNQDIIEDNDNVKMDDNNVTETFQNEEYIYSTQPKIEPQQNYMAADLSTTQYENHNDHASVGFLNDLQQFSQNEAYFNNTDTAQLPVSSQPSTLL